jgi:hypothetical protein
MKREINREISIVMLEFWSVVRGWEESVYGIDVESVVQDSFDRYDNVWRSYCRRWLVFDGRRLDLDEDAFMNYVYEGELKVYSI